MFAFITLKYKYKVNGITRIAKHIVYNISCTLRVKFLKGLNNLYPSHDKKMKSNECFLV